MVSQQTISIHILNSAAATSWKYCTMDLSKYTENKEFE